jgi:hypothetical protein
MSGLRFPLGPWASDFLTPAMKAGELFKRCTAAIKGLVVIRRADRNNLMMIGEQRHFHFLKEFVQNPA